MSGQTSSATGNQLGDSRVCALASVARSSLYAWRRGPSVRTGPGHKRGPKTELSDDQLLARIREVLAASPFVGEGHRKVWARLRHKGVRVGKNRVLRLMREAGILAPTRAGRPRGPATHDGTITTERPDEMWGTDMTRTQTRREGSVAVFVAVDHCTGECVGIHAAVEGNRFEALEPIRQGVRAHFRAFERGVAQGLALRHDHGSCYMARAFQSELAFLGIASSPAFVRQPEGNGCAERFIKTLKEQLLWVGAFETLDALNEALQAFRRRYNDEWVVERLGYQTPRQARAAFERAYAEAA